MIFPPIKVFLSLYFSCICCTGSSPVLDKNQNTQQTNRKHRKLARNGSSVEDSPAENQNTDQQESRKRKKGRSRPSSKKHGGDATQGQLQLDAGGYYWAQGIIFIPSSHFWYQHQQQQPSRYCGAPPADECYQGQFYVGGLGGVENLAQGNYYFAPYEHPQGMNIR